jgi:hypothetical protein
VSAGRNYDIQMANESLEKKCQKPKYFEAATKKLWIYTQEIMGSLTLGYACCSKIQ